MLVKELIDRQATKIVLMNLILNLTRRFSQSIVNHFLGVIYILIIRIYESPFSLLRIEYTLGLYYL